MAAHERPAGPNSAAHVIAAQASPCDELVVRSQPSGVDRPCRRKRLALAATILGSSMAFIDGSVVNVALASIQSELGASVAAIQWVVNAYLLFLGSLVLVGGSMGDRLGRRTVFIAGIGLFTLASIACGLAPGSGTLIAARRRARHRCCVARTQQSVDHRRRVRRSRTRPCDRHVGGRWARSHRQQGRLRAAGSSTRFRGARSSFSMCRLRA